MKPTLFLLAAGMGSRYGGLKQLDTLGPQGQTIMDYSIYDAINAGFGKLVFVIRKDFEDDFRKIVLTKYQDKIPCELVFQSLDANRSRRFHLPRRPSKALGYEPRRDDGTRRDQRTLRRAQLRRLLRS